MSAAIQTIVLLVVYLAAWRYLVKQTEEQEREHEPVEEHGNQPADAARKGCATTR